MSATVSVQFDKARWLVIALGFVGVSVVLWYGAVSSPADPFRMGGSTQWFLVNPYYFWVLYVPLIFVNLYMLAWIIVRHVLFARVLGRVFGLFEVEPQLHHPDGCNGFAAVGNVSMSNAFIVVLIGFWVAFFMAYPIVLGQRVNVGIDTVAMFVVYLAAVPALLLSGVWPAHKAMAEARHRQLDVVSAQIRTLLAETDADHIVALRGCWRSSSDVTRSNTRSIGAGHFALLPSAVSVWAPLRVPLCRGRSRLRWTRISSAAASGRPSHRVSGGLTAVRRFAESRRG